VKAASTVQRFNEEEKKREERCGINTGRVKRGGGRKK